MGMSSLAMTQSKMTLICFIMFIMLTWDSSFAQAITDKACDVGDFCTYKCRCSRSCRGSGGFCPNNAKCSSGWFGLRCQYHDLLTSAFAKLQVSPRQMTTSWLTDRNDSTCNSDTNLKSLTVSLRLKYPLNWIRIVLMDPRMMSTIKILYDETMECQKQTWSSLDKNTMDIRCEDKAFIENLKIEGNIISICSLYISGGRNIAFKQSASQSSTYSNNVTVYGANLAVDGNNETDFEHNSCSQTLEKRMSTFNLTLNSDYDVNYVELYNRGDYRKRISGFTIQTFNPSGEKVDDLKDTNENSFLYYKILLESTDSISTISISKEGILTICELEAYGECPAGKWSLPCTKQCTTSCPTSCHRDDGSCNTVCAGYSNPPECTKVCLPTKWGINCVNDCSTRCVDTSCDSKTGLCDRGCLGYSDPPYCTLTVQESGQYSKSFVAGIGVGIGIMVILVIIVLVIVVLCMKVRPRYSRPKAPRGNVHNYDECNIRDYHVHTYEQVTETELVVRN